MSDTRKYNQNVTLPMGSAVPKLPSEKVTRPMSEILQVVPQPVAHRSEPFALVHRKGDAFSEAVTAPLSREQTLAAEARAMFERNFGVKLAPDLGPAPKAPLVIVDEAPAAATGWGHIMLATALLAAVVVLLALAFHTVVPARW